MRSLFALFLVAVLLVSGAPSETLHAQSSYPMEVGNFPGLKRFPVEVTGYLRGEVMAFAPEMSVFSVAYNRNDTQLQNAVTLYFAPRLNDTKAQLRDEKAAVIAAHPDAKVISERVLTLRKDDRAYEATLITFEYTDSFAQRRQKLRSFLLVAFTAQQRFKVRSTAPTNQGSRAEDNLIPLLNGVSWVQ